MTLLGRKRGRRRRETSTFSPNDSRAQPEEEEVMFDHSLNRRDFVLQSGMLTAAAALGGSKRAEGADEMPTLGQGNFQYRPVVGWGVLDDCLVKLWDGLWVALRDCS